LLRRTDGKSTLKLPLEGGTHDEEVGDWRPVRYPWNPPGFRDALTAYPLFSRGTGDR